MSAVSASTEAIESAVALALPRLEADGFVAYPTETVWGLGACADRPAAVERLIRFKGRGDSAPLAVLIPEPTSVAALGCRLDARASQLVERYWPGPLMLVLPCEREFAPGVAGASGALGVRCSPHPLSRALATALEARGLGPLTSTSLNRTGEPPARDFAAARALVTDSDDLDLPLLLGSPALDAGDEAPSTVVDCTSAQPRILREGAIPAAELEEFLSG